MTTDTDHLTTIIAERERRRRVKRIIVLVLLVLLLALITWAALYYQANRRLPIPFVTGPAAQVEPPQFLYAITGPEGPNALAKPIGVCVTRDDRVYVVDSKRRAVSVYRTDGGFLFSFHALQSKDATRLAVPGDVVESPDGEIWVTDRRLRGIFIFSKDGRFLRRYEPKSDPDIDWGPVSVAFDEEGNVYVVDIGNNQRHQVFVFDREGDEVARWGTTKQAANLEDAPGRFYFPNGIVISPAGDVFIADSENRRVQVFDKKGTFKYIIPTSGTPRGLIIDDQDRLLVVDVFAHGVDVYTLKGQRITSFGSPGVGPGQFQFPNDIALDARGRIYVTDRENHQVQVWGWPASVVPPIEPPKKPVQWGICLSPLLLLLIPLLRRKRSFVVTEDFIDGMAAADAMDVMTDRRFVWIVPEVFEARFRGRVVGGVKLDELLRFDAHSESDVRDLVDRTGVDRETATILTMAERVGRLASERDDLREPARVLGVDVYDRERFMEEFARRKRT